LKNPKALISLDNALRMDLGDMLYRVR
jgi:hypothetical protein